MKRICSKAPLRLGLAGGGTDVSPYSDLYGGAVMNATINMYAYCYIVPLEQSTISLESRDYNKYIEYPVSPELPLDGTLDLFKSIYNRLIRQYRPELKGFRLVTFSDAPYGSGLGGSSTLVVAIIQCFAEWWKLPLGEYDIATLAFEIERIEANLRGGKQDHYAATFGGMNFMEFFSDRVIVNPLRIKDSVINELEASLLLCFTGRSRESAHIIDSQIQNVQQRSDESVEAMHRLKIDAVEMKEAILTSQLDRFAEILDRSWINKKKMSVQISNPGIEELYVLAKENGAKAGKVSGAGGGGFMMFFADPLRRFKLKDSLSKNGFQLSDVSFSNRGVTSWIM